jgi:hypothetical protein
MKLWTLQPIGFLDRLRLKGIAYGDWRRVDRHFKGAYKWLVGQMQDRGISINGRAPLWAWHKWLPPEKFRPDLRYDSVYGYVTPDTTGVRIELEVPDELVCLTRFNLWHDILNNTFVTISESEFDDFCKREDNGILTESEKKATWQRVFKMDLKSSDVNWCNVEKEPIQATLPYIDYGWVVKVDEFTSRRRCS